MRKSIANAAWLKAAQIIFLILACGAGADYLMTPPKTSLYIVETYIPAIPAGLLFLCLGIMGLAGEWWIERGRNIPPSPPEVPMRYLYRAENRWWWSFVAHVGLCGVYMGIAAGCITEQIVNGHLYGMRVALAMFALAAGHWMFAQRARHVT